VSQRPKYIDKDELKILWRMLERLQADTKGTEGVGWVWSAKEKEALVTVMDAVKDTYSLPDA
jgi:hypothetical protein